jgi:penicillin amidase
MNLVKTLFRLALGRRLPTHEGILDVRGIHHPVRIRRDGYGVPYIEAENDAEAWFGLGFCHGQDRPFQIEQLLRVVRGTLAAWVGPEALVVDRLSRRIGFYRDSEQQWAMVPEEIKTWIAAYAQGVNEGIERGLPRRPHAFVLLRAQPTPYSPLDVLGVMRLQSFSLSNNWVSQLARLKILTEDGPEALKALDASYPERGPVTSPPTERAGPVIDRLAEGLARFQATVGIGGASNNWAVSPSRTVTGRPLLANDPHMSTTLPSHWYLAHVRTPSWAAAGNTITGAPGIIFGHNGFAAWGGTNGMIDETDLFLEEIGPDGHSVREGDRFVSCEVRREVIGEAPVEEEVLITPRGPIVSPLLEGELGALSMRATWMAPRPLDGLLIVHLARSFDAFRQCFEHWTAPAQNMAYADETGTIGWQLMGEVPRRRKGWGYLPAAGWDPEAGWEEASVPFKAMPFDVDPEAGFIATANAKPTKDGESPFLGVDWLEGYRLARIVEVLETRHNWDLVGMQALQMDKVSLPWREMRDAVLAMPAETDPVRRGLTVLSDWDGVVRAGAPGATIFEAFVAEMARTCLQAKAPNAAAWGLDAYAVPLMGRPFHRLWRLTHLVDLVCEQPAGWFPQGWPQAMAEGLDRTVRTLTARYGDNPTRWAWGRVRPLTLTHMLGGRKPLDRIFNLGPFPWAGDDWTVSAAYSDFTDVTANPGLIASMRMVIDVGNWDASRFVLPGGQSGHPLSPHYDDQLPLWQRGEGIPIAWSPQRIDAVTETVLDLVPVRSSEETA